jgi:hypothetical protein
MPGAKYELLAVAFGGKGRSVSTTQELAVKISANRKTLNFD